MNLPSPVLVPIRLVKPNPNNPRIIKDDKFKKLVRSIQDFPAMLELRPIVVNADGVVLGGNMRLKACQAAGLTEVPVIRAETLTPEQQREFVIKDNVGFGEWEWNALANEWDAADLDAWGLDVPVVEPGKAVGNTDADDTPEPPKEPITRFGDVIQLGPHRLVCGDSTDTNAWTALEIPAKAMVFTSPPYGVGKNAKLRDHYVPGRSERQSLYQSHDDSPDEWLQLMRDWTALALAHCSVVLCNVQQLANNKRAFVAWMHEYNHHIADVAVWDKNGGAPQMQRNVLTNAFEWVVILSNETPASRAVPLADFHGTQSNVVRVDPRGKNPFSDVHRAVMPVDFAKWGIGLCSMASAVVDPFGGTGTTLIAAELLGKPAKLIEMDPRYCDVIVRRWEEFTGQTAVRST